MGRKRAGRAGASRATREIGSGWAKREERLGEEVPFFQSLFFKKTFQNLNSFKTLNTSILFQIFKLILKTFKTSHK
jgi:hypothetical protein